MAFSNAAKSRSISYWYPSDTWMSDDSGVGSDAVSGCSVVAVMESAKTCKARISNLRSVCRVER